MKRFRIFVKKEFLHIFRDKRTLLVLFGMPLVQVLLFGYAITNEIKDARIAIYDPSRDALTDKLTDKLLASGYFRLDDRAASMAAIRQDFKQGRIKMAVIFPPQAARKYEHDQQLTVQLIADASDPNTASTLTSYASSIIRQYMPESSYQNEPPGMFRIETEVRMLFNQELKGVYMFVPGVMTLILMLVSAMLTSIAITREKEMGMMELLLVSPVKPAVVIAGKVLPYFLLSIINAALILIVGVAVFGMPVRGNVLLLSGEMLLFVLTSLSLGIFISTKTDRQQTAMMMSMFALLMPTVLLSGFIFPLESMPWPLQWLANILPAKWFIIILKGIMLKGTGLAILWRPTAILFGMTVLFLFAGIKSFKTRLSS